MDLQFFTMIKTDRNIDVTYLKSMWRNIALKNHPDKGGDIEEFKKAQNEYEYLLGIANAGFTASQDSPESYDSWESFIWNVSPIVREKAIECKPICSKYGAELEVCGTWIWIGNTKPSMAKELKEIGLRWAGRKQKWFFAGTPKSRKSGRVSMDKIRSLYGSERFKDDTKESKYMAVR